MPLPAPFLIFRSETFGGTVFSSHDATFLELDEEAFALVRDSFLEPRGPHATPLRGYPMAFVRKIREELLGGAWEPAGIRVVEHGSPGEWGSPIFHVPSLVDFQITERCGEGCPHCYASSTTEGKDVPIADALRAISSFAEAGVCQIAVGGGEPLLHPHIDELLAAIRSHGMVPNLTTSARNISDAQLWLLKRTCGAVALSLEAVGEAFSLTRQRGFASFLKSLDALLGAGIPVTLQITVGSHNLGEIPAIVDFCLTRPIYGVIFLAFKPVGRGRRFGRPLVTHDDKGEVVRVLSSAFERLQHHTRVGYDCCIGPLITGFSARPFGQDHGDMEGCSALRGSVGVNTDLDVLPCTFLTDRVVGNLRSASLLDIWRNHNASAFRTLQARRLSTAGTPCSTCRHGKHCLGGCPVMELVPCGITLDKITW